ncbi:MAG TPA: protein kinase [Longimicrobiales bacterium]|nr:protein kinase [Longimicrobiales bacterium]
MDLAERLRAALADRYRIEAEIGRGGMAVVFRAEDLKHHRTVAIKVLKQELAESIEAERFLQEIRIVAHLQHPHILTLLDSGEVDGTLYYVMPFVEGESLREKLAREQELPVTDAVRILAEVADALAYAHQNGVVHRDTKPDNVLLSGRHALVADFGVAKALDAAKATPQATATGVALGTPSYMAPEQATADAPVDHRADIYALGVLGYELLTGRPPYTGTTLQILGAQATGKPRRITEVRPAVPEPLAVVLMRCLETRPADRWQSAEEVRDQLEWARTPATGTEIRSVPPARRRAWTGGWRVAAAAAGGVVVAIAAFALLKGRAPAAAGQPEDSLPTLAVLPFDVFSGDSAQAYLSDGVTEALTSAIAKVQGLHVISRTSVMRYRGRADRPPLPQIGRELHADLLMEGSVTGAGDQVRITAQLITASNDHHIWSDSYDGDLSDVLSFLSDVARAVAGQVQVALTKEDEQRLAVAPSTDPKVMQAVLRARYLMENETTENVNQAINLLNQALDLDPSFAPAWGMMAHVQSVRVSWFAQNEAGTTIVPFVEQAARRALALDSGDVDAQIGMAAIHELQFQWDDAVRTYRSILERNPSYGLAGVYLTNTLTWMGRYEEAEAVARRTVAIDPFSVQAQHELANVLFESRRLDATMVQMRKALEVDPTDPKLRAFVTGYLVRFGHCEGPGRWLPAELGIGDAVSEAERLMTSGTAPDPSTLGTLVWVFASCGHVDRARQLYQQLQAMADTASVPPFVLAAAKVTVGDMDGVLDLLEQSFEQEGANIRTLTNGESSRAIRDSLRGNPRFEALVDRIGLPRSPLKWSTERAARTGTR